MVTSWLDAIPGLAALPPDEKALILERTGPVTLPAGARIFAPGEPAKAFLLVLSGTIKVAQYSEGGRVIVLYRRSGGESCILTTACLLGGDDYTAEAVTETPALAAAIPRDLFERLLDRSRGFRDFVFTGFAERLSELFRLVDDVAFERMDVRLASRLLVLAGPGDRIAVTQQALAEELGSAREVVSRVLGELTRRGWVEHGRGEIVIVDRAALARAAARRD